ncbi:MAG: hypothetical protein PVG89_03700 [Gammaproteobacteria bacterium]
MSEDLVCWKCGSSIADLPLPLSRRATCSACGADLHVCLLCKFYDKTRSNQCREPIAEYVQYKEKANFCACFQPRTNAWRPMDNGAAQSTRDQLAELFGGPAVPDQTPADPDQSRAELEKLFGMDDTKNDSGNNK